MHGISRHCDFRYLMALYEANYVRLKRLVPDLAGRRAGGRSSAADQMDLHLRILESATYTSTLELTYYFTGHRGTDGEAPVPEPKLVIRVYHDARLAEATYCQDLDPGPRNRLPFEGRSTCAGEKLVINQFLEKWLIYALKLGHQFEAVDAGGTDEERRCLAG